ncbi:NAD(P) transhydrogenase subunit alpha [Porphyromonadaceae bacterium W3.11]|nr:NAD(P) transhydrogenase subunit alpha [Porphyromonadaceae bacterium W3.11]
MTHPLVLVLIFIVSSIVGYFVIRKIPSLLHTPLMSGMNALSGITVIGALIVLIDALSLRKIFNESIFGPTPALGVAIIIAGIAIIFAMVNIVGGFGVTERMLKMFKSKKQKGGVK